MANDHGMDFGAEGLQHSLRMQAERGVPVLGIVADEARAYAPHITEVKGQRIGVIAANDIFDDPLRAAWTAGPGKAGIASAEEAHQERLLAEVRATRDRVDTLVVFLHYGTEKQTCPNPRQQDLARALTAAGADIVVGGHAHRVQGAGYLGGQLVAYGLGNFIFQANSPEGASSGVLVVTATGRRIDGYQWKPAVIRNSLPVPLSGAAEAAALATMDQRRDCAGLTATPTTPTAPPTAAPAAVGPTTTTEG
jgi:poly-gamma-glutamate synthesis protein (capsule biosynthesis protein)